MPSAAKRTGREGICEEAVKLSSERRPHQTSQSDSSGRHLGTAVDGVCQSNTCAAEEADADCWLDDADAAAEEEVSERRSRKRMQTMQSGWVGRSGDCSFCDIGL